MAYICEALPDRILSNHLIAFMNLDELKRLLQAHFTDGLVTIVGSGVSAAAGIPGMSALADYLRAEIPASCPASSVNEWDHVGEQLATGTDLETALRGVEADSELIPLIVKLTANFIYQAEQATVLRIVRGEYDPPMRRLIRHLAFAEGAAHIITSNYDRLVEYSVELAGLAVDTGFYGTYYARYMPCESKVALSQFVPQRNKATLKRVLRAHVALHKPHGSLDWFLHGDEPVRCSHFIDAQRLMITPGTSKYRLGYDSPFDLHRGSANQAIDAASRFLTLGYGFNDDQLETHLRPRLRAGRPCVLLAKALTESARKVVEECDSVLALVEGSSEGIPSTTCHYGGITEVFDGVRLWDLDHFLNEVLE
jgi:hypothetical protein